MGNQTRYICFDTETAGLDSNKFNLLTAHFIVLDNDLNKIDSLDLSISSEIYTITAKALEINKIDIVKHHSSTLSVCIKTASKMLLDFLEKNTLRYRYTPIGHNIQFDISFIKNSALITEQNYNKYISCCTIDTLVVANFMKMSGALPSNLQLNLSSLCKHYKLEWTGNSHSAQADTEMTILLLIALKEQNNIANVIQQDKKRKLV